MSEHNEWKKKTPFSYDFIISHSLPSHSNTVDWSSSPPKPSLSLSLGHDPSLHIFLFNTYFSNSSASFLTIADVPVPSNDDPLGSIPRVRVIRNMVLDERLNVARFMPQKPKIVCAKTYGLDMFVFDCTKPQKDPVLKLTGLRDSKYARFGLAWHPIREGYILSSDHDSIYLWDVLSGLAQHDKVLRRLSLYECERIQTVVDLQWHRKNGNLFGSADFYGDLDIWDLRSRHQKEQSVKAHKSELHSFSFHPNNEWLVATASSDKTVGLFDLRRLKQKLSTLKGHKDKATKVEWDPKHQTVLASSGDDRKVIIWDINRIGDEKLRGDDKPPELLFSHGGHTGIVEEFSWNKNEPWVISSVSRDKTLQVWKLAKSIYG